MGKGGGDGMPRERACIASWGFLTNWHTVPNNLWRFERAFVIHPTSSPGQTPTFIFLLLLGSTFFHYVSVHTYIHTWSCTFFIFLFFRTGSLGGFFFSLLLLKVGNYVFSHTHTHDIIWGMMSHCTKTVVFCACMEDLTRNEPLQGFIKHTKTLLLTCIATAIVST